jgi:hypothetical protein
MERCEEEFLAFLGTFVTVVWELLLKVLLPVSLFEGIQEGKGKDRREIGRKRTLYKNIRSDSMDPRSSP